MCFVNMYVYVRMYVKYELCIILINLYIVYRSIFGCHISFFK